MAFGLALFWAAAGYATRVLRGATGFAVALCAAELARSYVLTGFPWALIGHIWIDTPVAQAAALLGPVGLTLITLLAAAGLARLRAVPAAAALAGVAAAWGYGLWALSQPLPAAKGITLRLVQPAAEQRTKWDPELAQQFLDRLLAFTALKPAPDLVIWPETALPYLLERHPELADMIATAGYSAGIGPQLLDLGPKLGHVLPLICYEAVFPQDLRGTERPDWLLQITNDAWFGTQSGPFQHAAQARLRAIETGLPLVRVANTGVTAVYDARGRITAALDFGIAAYLDTALPGALPPTPYARWGEGPVLVLLCGAALALMRRRNANSA